jgi:Fe-S-cluster containining protein
MQPEDVGELARQVERGNLFAHTALSEQALRANETEALVNGLIDLLVQRGLVHPEALVAAAAEARRETAERGELASLSVSLRVDAADAAPSHVDCEPRLPICRAACCRLRFALSAEEVESGPMKWDLGRPYRNRQGPEGYCHQIDLETKQCGIYDERPCVCRRYDCSGDGRIWKDFERMELNNEWIDAHLGALEPTLIDVFMDRHG